MKLENKTALVVGAGTVGGGWGIGKACAVQLASEGSNVVCFDRDPDLAEQTAQAIRDAGGNAMAVAGDASRSGDVQAVVETAADRYGGLDLLVNNVGIILAGGVVELAEKDWDTAFDVNLKSCYLSMKYAIPAMQQRGGGSIVNISSISSIRYLGKNYAAYYTTKAAMNHLTRVTAAEYARSQVRVNAVLPGLMDTPMAKQSAQKNWGVSDAELDAVWAKRAERVPIGWLGDAFDIARAVVFLISDDARFITGQTVVVDGGLTLSS